MVTRVPRVREFGVYNPGAVKFYTALQAVCHRLNICASLPVCRVLALWHGNGHRKLVTRFVVIRRI